MSVKILLIHILLVHYLHILLFRLEDTFRKVRFVSNSEPERISDRPPQPVVFAPGGTATSVG